MLAVVLFAVGAAVSLATSWLLVSRLERVGERIGLSEAMLGLVAALAADAPEITAAIAALASHEQQVGAGVVLGSNVFNLAALLGLGAVVAGRIRLHRRVVALSGSIALWVALVCMLVVTGALQPLAGLVLAAAAVGLYVFILGTAGRGLRLPASWRAWLHSAVAEEELELEDAIRPRRGRWTDAAVAAGALAIVVIASITMERAAVSLGSTLGMPEIITGGLVLAAVTSLPNAVAAVYLARRGRGAATLSTALNSNTLNVLAGLLLPGALLGLRAPSGQARLVATWYGVLTLAVLCIAWWHRGLSRYAGAAIIAAYSGFTVSVVVTGYAAPSGAAVVSVLSVLSAALLGRGLGAGSRAQRSRPEHACSARARTAEARPVSRAPGRALLLPSWTVRRLWAASMIAASAVAVIDAATGRRIVLIGLLVVGPCTALLTGRWLPVAATGAWACGLAVILGLPDRIWATGTHIVFISAVAVVAAAAVAGSVLISRKCRARRDGRFG